MDDARRNRLTPRAGPRCRRSTFAEPLQIVVVVYHREDDTRAMFRQLARVTRGYELVIVDNGFDDMRFLRRLRPVVHVRNDANPGAIRSINQGLDEASGRYVCVLHNDVLIYDEGWLEHVVGFLERRPDVGLVGLAGRHVISEDGSPETETTVAGIEWYPDSMRPTWRFTEVATIDGLGWVMRNIGLRLDERYGLMHFYDLDLSLQYIEAGYRVYSAAVEMDHTAETEGRSTRDTDDYLAAIGGDDNTYYASARELFREKWRHMLPMTRGFRDEAYAYHRIDELIEKVRSAEGYVGRLEAEIAAKNTELENAASYARKVEEEHRAAREELERTSRYAADLEKRLEEPKAGRRGRTA